LTSQKTSSSGCSQEEKGQQKITNKNKSKNNSLSRLIVSIKEVEVEAYRYRDRGAEYSGESLPQPSALLKAQRFMWHVAAVKTKIQKILECRARATYNN
jgi:hypothetical protein